MAMEIQNEKCVMVIDEELPLGLIANTAGIIGITLGKHRPEAVGGDVFDKSGRTHRGVIEFPVPILRAGKEKLRAIRTRLYEPEFSELLTVDFSDVAQSCKNYGEYIERSASVEERELSYLGIGICGARKLVNKLTGDLPLLR